MSPLVDAPFEVRKAVALEMVASLERLARTRLVKARVDEVAARRDALIEEKLPAYEAEFAAYVAGFIERNVPDLEVVEKALSVFPDPERFDWDHEAGLLRQIVGRWYFEMAEAAYGDVSFELGIDLAFDIEQPALGSVRDIIGERVAGITETSRSSLANAVASARDTGTSVDVLERRLADMFTGWSKSRAHMVALTETANAYALSSAAGWRQSGLVAEVDILDGPDCGWTSHDDPDLAQGSRRTLDEYEKQPLSHPHCQRAAAPVPLR